MTIKGSVGLLRLVSAGRMTLSCGILTFASVVPCGAGSLPTPFGVAKPMGKPVAVLLGRGTVSLAGLRQEYRTKRGLTYDSSFECRVVLRARGVAAQSLVALSPGLPDQKDCVSLIAVGRVPAPRGRERIVLMYRTFPSFVVMRPDNVQTLPVFIERDAASGARWSVNRELGEKLDTEGAPPTIAHVRARLARDR